MSKEMTVIVLGVWAIVLPYLGIPGSWRTVLLVLTGIGLIVVGLYLRAEAMGRGTTGSNHRTTFVENTEHERKEGINSLN